MTAIAISSDGKKCISASMSCLRFWRLDLDQPLQTKISYSEGPITSVDISENLKFGLVASLQSIKHWSLEEGDLPQEYAIIPAYNMGKVRFNKSSTKIIWLESSTGFWVWDIASKKELYLIPIIDDEIIDNFIIAGDDQSIIAHCMNKPEGKILIYKFKDFDERYHQVHKNVRFILLCIIQFNSGYFVVRLW